MQKLTISKDELRCHKKYFYGHAVINLRKMRKEIRGHTAVSRRQRKFLAFCLYYRKRLAVGSPDQLRKLQEIIDQNYKDIQGNKRFRKRLYDAFGYDHFSCSNIGGEVLKRAKIKAGKSPGAKYDDKKILDALFDELDCFDTEVSNEVRSKIKRTAGGMTKDVLEMIISEILVTALQKKQVSVKSLSEWNPYIMQLHRKERTCPYCNRQFITPLYSENRKVRADLDHFYSKDKYPWFSMSIYNLVPCCKFCNSSLKGTKEFALSDKTPYEISIDDLAEFKYRPTRKLNVEFREKDSAVLRYKEIFKTEELYQSHGNIAQDLLAQARRYPRSRIRTITDTRLITEKELYRLIIGKTSTAAKISEEPLSKFKRDMVKEIWGIHVLMMVEE